MNYDEIIEVPCRKLKLLPEQEIDKIVETVIDHYYEFGFPYYPVDEEKIRKEVSQLRLMQVEKLELDGNIIQQSMIGLNTVNTFHPEMWSVRCRNSMTPMELFWNRKKFHEALKKRIKYSDTKLQAFNIRKSLRVFGAQSVSNFRPSVARWICRRFGGDSALDPCAGYGGRLMGAVCSDIDYTGVDPAPKTIEGNSRMADKIGGSVSLFNVAFEDFESSQKFDLVFTSPPYFDLEKYSDDSNQSYIRYPKYDKWVDGFLRPLVENSYSFLNRGGHFVLNVGGKIVNDTLEIGKRVFGEPVVYWMRLSKILGKKDKLATSHKVEPIFVWKKQ